MTFLAPEADRIVRTAVDAYFEGRLRPEIDGEAIFETRNSRYRLMLLTKGDFVHAPAGTVHSFAFAIVLRNALSLSAFAGF